MSVNDNSTHTIPIVIGNEAVVFTSPNLITYNLPGMGYTSGRDEIALKSLSIYYSWPNISAALGNNSFSYIWPSTGTTHPVVMADGIYEFADIQRYFEQVMFENGHYLLDSTGSPIYFAKLISNAVLYCVTLIMTPLPTTLPTGWTNPAAVNLTGAAGKTPQFIVSSSIAYLTGFAAATYPSAPVTTVYYANSGTPQITQSTVIRVRCNLVDNKGFSTSTDVLAAFPLPAETLSGSLINYTPFAADWVPTRASQSFNSITLQLTDQLNRPLLIRDPACFVATLTVRRRV